MKTRDVSEGQPGDNSTREPYRVRLPGFISDEDIGLGDLIKRATSAIGVRPCGGCERRATTLNRGLSFSRHHPK
jgi:hypothetical protein